MHRITSHFFKRFKFFSLLKIIPGGENMAKVVKGVSVEMENVIKIDELIEMGVYKSFSEFVDAAITEKIQSGK